MAGSYNTPNPAATEASSPKDLETYVKNSILSKIPSINSNSVIMVYVSNSTSKLTAGGKVVNSVSNIPVLAIGQAAVMTSTANPVDSQNAQASWGLASVILDPYKGKISGLARGWVPNNSAAADAGAVCPIVTKVVDGLDQVDGISLVDSGVQALGSVYVKQTYSNMLSKCDVVKPTVRYHVIICIFFLT